jgi:hypothetical protein
MGRILGRDGDARSEPAHDEVAGGGTAMVRHLTKAAMTGAAALSLLAAGAAQAQPKHADQCFFPNQWEGWKATPDAKTIILRVRVNTLYRLDLTEACPELRVPGAHLVTQLRGSELYCSPLDFDLRVAEPSGPAVPCIVRGMSQLSPAEAAALPRDLRP